MGAERSSHASEPMLNLVTTVHNALMTALELYAHSGRSATPLTKSMALDR